MRKPPPIWISSPREITTSLRSPRQKCFSSSTSAAALLLTTVAASAALQHREAVIEVRRARAAHPVGQAVFEIVVM